MKCKELKEEGSGHYKAGDVEPIDLYKSGGTFQDFAISSIIKYAFRNRRELVGRKISISDMEKMKHYASLLEALSPEEKTEEIQFVIGTKAE